MTRASISRALKTVRWTVFAPPDARRGPGCSIPALPCSLKRINKEKSPTSFKVELFYDPCGNRTHVNGVRGRCLNRLTNGP